MGMIMAAFSAASVFGVPFGLYIANLFNWHAPFFFVVILGVLLVPFLIKFLPKMDAHLFIENRQKISPTQLIGDVFRNSSQLYALALTAVFDDGTFYDHPVYQSVYGIQYGIFQNANADNLYGRRRVDDVYLADHRADGRPAWKV